jgi:hypothetical protein
MELLIAYAILLIWTIITAICIVILPEDLAVALGIVLIISGLYVIPRIHMLVMRKISNVRM